MNIRVSLSGERPDAAPLRALAGVGLLRGEFIFRELGVYTTDGPGLACMSEYLDAACMAFAGKPVWYRLCDFWSDEAATLRGNSLQLDEGNPIVGVRGIRRRLLDAAAFEAEVGAVCAVARRHPNLHMLLPFVQDADEFSDAARSIRRLGWRNRLGSMIEMPSAVYEAQAIAAAGASNLLVGLNDLSCLLLGRERGPNDMKLHRAIWAAIRHVAITVDARAEWGVGGSLTAAVLDLAAGAGADYVTLHYAELPSLLGIDLDSLPDLDHVRRVKAKTRAAKQERRLRFDAGA